MNRRARAYAAPVKVDPHETTEPTQLNGVGSERTRRTAWQIGGGAFRI